MRYGGYWLKLAIALVAPFVLMLAAFWYAALKQDKMQDPRRSMLAMAILAILLPAHWTIGSIWGWLRSNRIGSEPVRVGTRGLIVAIGLIASSMAATQHGMVLRLYQFAISPDQYEDFSIELADAGRSIVYTGPLGFDAPRQLNQTMVANPAADALVIDSPGGWIHAGKGLAAALESSSISTVVARHECASACILPFESARRRVIEDGAYLGFHSARNDLLKDSDKNENEEFRTVLAQRKVPQAAIDKAVQTPSSSMWWPDVATLFKDNLIDAVRLGGRDLGPDDYFPAKVDEELGSSDFAPLIAGLGQFAPEVLGSLRQTLTRQVTEGASRAAMDATVRRTLAPAEEAAIGRAGDALQARRALWLGQVLRRFHSSQPQLCTDVWENSHHSEVMHALTPEEGRQLIDLIGEALRTARQSTSTPQRPAPAVLALAWRPAVVAIGNAAYDTRAARLAGRISDDDVCRMAIAFYEGLPELRPADEGAVLRWMATQN